MTNWEKFKEVFGLPTNVKKSMSMNICNMVDCRGIECDDCYIFKNDMQGTKFWRKELMDNYNGIETPVGYRKVVDLEVIKNMPSVTPTRKKGHWIMTNNYLTAAYETIDYVKCSCCGEESLEEGDYCPNCGAEMESEE